MPINYRQIRNITARELAAALVRDGFRQERSTGNHRRYYDRATGRRVSLSWHGGGRTFKIATLSSIIEEQAKWTEADLIRLKLIRE